MHLHSDIASIHLLAAAPQVRRRVVSHALGSAARRHSGAPR
jgi:hypothetical protein